MGHRDVPCVESWDGSDTIGIFHSLVLFHNLHSRDSMDHKFISQIVSTRHGRVPGIETPWMTCRNQGGACCFLSLLHPEGWEKGAAGAAAGIPCPVSQEFIPGRGHSRCGCWGAGAEAAGVACSPS